MLNRNFWTFMFFLTLSASFWLFLKLEDEYDYTIEVPVKLVNVPDNVVITTPLPSSIRLMLHDNGGTLLKYRYSEKPDTILVDFNNYNKVSGHVSITTSDLAQTVVSGLEGTTKVVGYTPETVEYFYNFGIFRQLPVRVNGKVTADSLYSLADTAISPRFVKVYASDDVLDTMTQVFTKSFTLNKINKSTTRTVDLSTMRGVRTVPAKVRVTFDADQVTEKTVQVPVEHINFPAGKTLKTFPGTVSVIFHVGMKRYSEITADKFAIVVTYDEVANNKENRLRLTLKNKPHGVSHVRIDPKEVEFLIEDASDE
jgi:hypothetical protein